MLGSLEKKKGCRRQGVLTMEVTSDSYTTTEKVTGGETQSFDGLSELTMRQNPNLKNSDLSYGSDTMLRGKEFSDEPSPVDLYLYFFPFLFSLLIRL